MKYLRLWRQSVYCPLVTQWQKKDPPEFYVPLLYFTLMEVLQAFSYSVIDQCALPSNQMATLLGYLHVAFQPFFLNYLSLYFVPRNVAQRIAPFVYGLCFVTTILMIVQVYPFSWAPACVPGSMFCATNLCTVSGNWHIAWNVPYTSLYGNFPVYFLVGILLPLLYGSWRATLYHFVAGPAAAYLLTSNPNEQPAIWCLLSVCLLLIAINTRLRDLLYVTDWALWPPHWRNAQAQERKKS